MSQQEPSLTVGLMPRLPQSTGNTDYSTTLHLERDKASCLRYKIPTGSKPIRRAEIEVSKASAFHIGSCRINHRDVRRKHRIVVRTNQRGVGECS